MAKTAASGSRQRLGWCSDGYHEICIMETISGIVCECDCENHGVHKDDWKTYQERDKDNGDS